jgi:hypothetical protein
MACVWLRVAIAYGYGISRPRTSVKADGDLHVTSMQCVRRAQVSSQRQCRWQWHWRLMYVRNGAVDDAGHELH